MSKANTPQPLKDFLQIIWDTLHIPVVYLSPQLIPSHNLSNINQPSIISRSYEHLLFGGLLATLSSGKVYSIVERFYTTFLVLPLGENEGYCIAGPYLNHELTTEFIHQLGINAKLSLDGFNQFICYYQNLTILPTERLFLVFNYILQHIYHKEPVTHTEQIDLTQEQSVAEPLPPEKTEDMLIEVIENRYATESNWMQLVAQGNFEDAYNAFICPHNLIRTPDRLRNSKNLMFVANTLLRKSAQEGSVHPYYIDRISGKFAAAIERVTSLDGLSKLRYEMVKEYCELVRKYSLRKYSPLLRKAINYIDLHLDAKLTLAGIANQLNISSNYLSSLFNKEMNQSISDYINKKRIEQASYFVLNTDTPFGDIAEMTGFSDIQYFSKIFKKITGVTPSEYRKQS